jgi:hypothetical protein
LAGAVGGGLILAVDSTPVRVAGLAAVVLSVLVVRLLVRQRRRAIEREIAATLTRRVAHTVPLKTREIVGVGFMSAAGLVYLGAGLLVLTAASPDRKPQAVTAVLFLIAALGVMDGLEVAVIAHRPALAEDAQSLAIDDVLRTEDARTVLTSLLPVVLSWTVLDLRPELSWPVLASLALLALLFCLALAAEHAHAPRPRETHA